jgi:hypothetical protein
MRRVHWLYVQSWCQIWIVNAQVCRMDSTSSAECTFRRTIEDCNDLQKIAKVSADFLRRGMYLSIICTRRPASFPPSHCI